MSSCAASSYTCFPKASSAFATSDSSPTGDAPLSCRFASNYSAQYRRPRPNHKPPRSSQRARFGSVPNVAAPWWSSRDLPLPSSNSVLHPFSPELPHETKIPSSLHRCASPPPGVVRPSCRQTGCPFPNSAQCLALATPKLRPNPSSFCFFQLHYLFPQLLPLQQHHSICIMGGSLQTAVSDAPRTTETTCTLTLRAPPIQH